MSVGTIIVLCFVAAIVIGLLKGFSDEKIKKQKGIHTFKINGQDYRYDLSKVDAASKQMDDIQIELGKIRTDNKEWERQANILYKHQNDGMSLEKDGNISRAISAYEKAVDYGRKSSKMNPSQYFHSIERLLILYRRVKAYEKEIALIQSSLNEDISVKDKDRLKDRLEKAKKLKDKLQ